MIKSLALLAALVIGTASMAKADIISINGADIYNTTSTTLQFTTVGNIAGTSTGIFSPFTDCNGCVSLPTQVINYGSFSTPTNLFAATENGDSLLVILESINSVTDGININGDVSIDINGVITPESWN